jgi:hypothetical protein
MVLESKSLYWITFCRKSQVFVALMVDFVLCSFSIVMRYINASNHNKSVLHEWFIYECPFLLRIDFGVCLGSKILLVFLFLKFCLSVAIVRSLFTTCNVEMWCTSVATFMTLFCLESLAPSKYFLFSAVYIQKKKMRDIRGQVSKTIKNPTLFW